ncbi:MAG: LPS export ABC transporter periplasmic protein LptC [Betaproteobacteria bacterium]|nr:LPS export ABC transporter periplasmic protein LptC [Betaproteobacteria bacterium]
MPAARLRTSGLFPLVILTLLAALTFWLEHATRPEAGGPDGKLRHDPDFIVDRFVARTLDPQGQLRHSLTARRMLHYPDNDTTDVTDPRLVYFGQEQPMRLFANHAEVSGDGNKVTLLGNVTVVRDATANDPAVVLTTTAMTVLPDLEQASTDKPVRIVQGQTVVTGVGLELDNKARVLKLLADVHANIPRKK